MKLKFSSLLLTLLCVFGSSMVLAQSTTGTILGQVTDSSGAAVVNAQVIVTNTLTGETHSITTNSQGQYVIPHLSVGVYRVESEAAGFKHSVRDGVTLAVNQEARTDLALQVGKTSESVEVYADTVQVNTYTPELGELVDSKKVVDLPLNGRNVYSLLVSLPGASSINAQTVPSRDNNSFVVNAGRATSNSCFIDGGFNNDIWRNQCSTPPNPDSIQEFRLLSSNSDVEFGRLPGAFMNIITKSGTNSYHGTAYEFLRNNALDAGTLFQNGVTPLKQNQYGFTVGGPVLKNKAFAFGSWEGLRQNQSQNVNSVQVPTAREKTGDFSAAGRFPGTAEPIDPGTGLPFPNGNIFAGTVAKDAVGTAIVNAIPTGNNADGTYTAASPANVKEWQYLLKGDYQLTKNQKVTVSWFQLNTTQGNEFAYFNQFPGWGGRVDGVQQHNLIVNHTWTASNSLLNEVRFNLMRRETPWNMVNGKTLDQFGMNFKQGGLKPVAPRIQVGGRFTTGAWDATGHDHSIGGSDTVTWIKGKHNIKLGSFVMAGYYAEIGTSTGGGHITESGGFTGNNLANMMLGYSSNFAEDSGDHPDESANYWHSFAQDTWQIAPRLTLTAGARYEITTPLVWTVNYISSFKAGQQSTVYPNAPKGLLFYGDQGVSRAGRPTPYNNIAPRIGIAYDPFGNGKTSIRAGYGLYYMAAYGDGLRAPQPFVLTDNEVADTSLVNPWARKGYNPFPYTVPTGAAAQFQLPMGAIVFANNATTPRLNQFNVTVQHQLTNNMSLQAAYVGSISRKMSGNIDQNNPVYGPGATPANVDQRRPLFSGGLQAVGTYVTGYNASYNALQIVVNQRMAHGLSFNTNYTWGKGTDLVSGDNYNGGLGFTDTTNPGRDKGPTSGLPRQIFNFSGTYNTPKFQNLGKAASALLGGWQANAIISLHSGTPVNITSGTDSNMDGVNNDRPNQTGNPSVTHTRTSTNEAWFGSTAFQTAPSGTYGNVGRNSLIGPGYINSDLSFFRLFPIYNESQLQFRAELFNAFNHANLNSPNGNLASGSGFGKITSATVGRIAQFGLKLSF